MRPPAGLLCAETFDTAAAGHEQRGSRSQVRIVLAEALHCAAPAAAADTTSAVGHPLAPAAAAIDAVLTDGETALQAAVALPTAAKSPAERERTESVDKRRGKM